MNLSISLPKSKKNQTKTPQKLNKDYKNPHPYPGRSLEKTTIPVSYQGLLYNLGTVAMGQGISLTISDEKLSECWNCPKRTAQYKLMRLEELGAVTRETVVIRKNGQFRSCRTIHLGH